MLFSFPFASSPEGGCWYVGSDRNYHRRDTVKIMYTMIGYMQLSGISNKGLLYCIINGQKNNWRDQGQVRIDTSVFVNGICIMVVVMERIFCVQHMQKILLFTKETSIG